MFWFVAVFGLQILQQLDQAKHVPDFNNYLSFIFSKGDSLPMEVSMQQHSCTAIQPCMINNITIAAIIREPVARKQGCFLE